jgi:two-component system sensor histidine kinase CpxA
MAARIEALVHAQGRILSDISHELRSPLARLNVALELARRKAGESARPDIERIEIEAERMNELIGRVLMLARAEQRPGASMTSIDLRSLVGDIAADASYEAQQQQKTVSFQSLAEAQVQGDAELLSSAVENVIRNAVRYTPQQSAVDVTLSSDGEAALVVVRDHGPGVPEAERERIFSPFHRVEPSRTRTDSDAGVGLGLSIARRSVEVHGGTITAENAAGGGLRVTIRIPLPDTSLQHRHHS